jgi:hypothetical protein
MYPALTSLKPLAIAVAVSCFSSAVVAARNFPKSINGMRKSAGPRFSYASKELQH